MKIGFIGAGKMAEGILAAIPNKRSVIMAETNAARAAELKARYRVRTTPDAAQAVAESDLIFLAVRPQDVDTVAASLRGKFNAGQTLVSIVAGKTLAKLRTAFGVKVKLIRVMPNLALRVGAGMCALTAAPSVRRSAAFAEVARILGGAGEVQVLEERAFDAVTALSGSGPAYFAYMLSAMAEGGAALGLKAEVALKLAQQTMFGTAKFLREAQPELKAFIDGVCTKGGTTAAGMKYLAKPAFKKMVAQTLAAAARRSAELA